MSLFDDVSPASPSKSSKPGKPTSNDSISKLSGRIFKLMFGWIMPNKEKRRYKPKYQSNKMKWRDHWK